MEMLKIILAVVTLLLLLSLAVDGGDDNQLRDLQENHREQQLSMNAGDHGRVNSPVPRVMDGGNIAAQGGYRPQEHPAILTGGRRASLLSLSNPGRSLLCNPQVCQRTFGPNWLCCGLMCVNPSNDKLNCGLCGNQCSFGNLCCSGRCVNVLRDKLNCGACNRKCVKGNCVLGLCGYN